MQEVYGAPRSFLLSRKSLTILKKLEQVLLFTPILVSKRRYIESTRSGFSKLCVLVFLEILESAEKIGFLETGF